MCALKSKRMYWNQEIRPGQSQPLHYSNQSKEICSGRRSKEGKRWQFLQLTGPFQDYNYNKEITSSKHFKIKAAQKSHNMETRQHSYRKPAKVKVVEPCKETELLRLHVQIPQEENINNLQVNKPVNDKWKRPNHPRLTACQLSILSALFYFQLWRDCWHAQRAHGHSKFLVLAR